MRACLVLALGVLPALGHGFPALREAALGDVTDEVRQAVREAIALEVPLLGEQALAPRPAAEALTRLEEVARRFPTSAAVQLQLAQVARGAGDAARAEQALARAVLLADGAAWALEEQAAFYEQRGDTQREVQILERLAARLADETRRPGGSERRLELRRVYERILGALAVRRVADPDRYRRALVELASDDGWALRRYLDELARTHDLAGLRRAVERYLPRRPAEAGALARALAAELESRRDLPAALGVYTRLLARDPVPEDAQRIYGDYLGLLDRALLLRPRRRALEVSLQRGSPSARLGARDRVLRGTELGTLVFLLLKEGKPERARTLLEQARVQDRTATAAELRGRARLAAAADAPELQITFLYAAARTAKGAAREEALRELGRALLDSPTRSALTPRAPLASFSLEKLDSGPSLLGGLVSLLFIGPRPTREGLERAETALGNGQRALAVLDELRRIAPRSRATQDLHARAVEFHRAYQLHAEAAALAEGFLRAFPNAPQYFDVGLSGAAAWVAAEKLPAAEKLWRRLLESAQRRADDAAHRRVLEAYVAALTAKRRDLDAVKVFAAEVKRRPEDRALLERFLVFVEQRNLFDDQVRLYREAARRFGGAGFHARLARFYLKQRRVKDFRELTEGLARSLGNEDLRRYLEESAGLDVRGSRDERAAFGRQRDLLLRALYRQALDRFPFDPAFARRVIASYATRDPNDRREEARLRVRYAVLDASLVDDFVQWRAGRGRLDEDLRAVAAGRNAAERILAARLLVARSRFEEALTAARRVAVDFPADRDEVRRVADLESSLGRPNRADAARAAVRTLDGYLAVAPADETMTTRAGDLLAEAGLVDEARLRYERIAALRPADRNAWLRLATVYWDYYLFDQAALAIERARRQVGDPDFGGEKLAAVYESARQREKAVREYVRVSWRRLDRTLGWSGGGPAAEDAPEGSAARADDGPEAGEGPADPPAAELQQRSPGAEQVTERLVYLMRRHKLGPRIDQAYAAAIKAAKADPRPAAAYADYLVAANRRDEARRVWLTAIATHADRFLLERAVAVGTVDGAPGSAIVIAARRRLAALSDQAPEQVYALAAALEDAAAVEPAAAALADLAARLRGGAALDPSETAATEEKLADLFQRARRPQEALAARRRAAEALPRAPQGHSGPREAIELRLAAELARAGRPDEAMALYRSVAAQVPGDPRPLIASADVRWQRGDQSGALQDLVRAVGQAQHLPAHVRGAVVVGLRQALIGRLAEIGREREVVDQYIELINRDPTRRDLCDAAITYARTHRSLDHHLLDYYQRAAARAPKDHRWPVILAWIYERRGQPAEAARAYAQALEIAPGRLDLARARADDLAAAGQWPLAAAAYRTVYELADHDRAIRLRVAEMLGRAGHVDEARREVQGLVLGSDRPGDYVSAALCFERMGLYADARGYAESALAIALEAPRTRGFTGDWGYVYARLAARTGLAGPAFTRLMQAAGRVREDSERKGNTAAWHERGLASVLEHAARAHLAHAVAEYAGSDNALGLRQALEAWIAAGPDRRAAAAAIAEVAGLPDLSRDLYQGGLGDPRRGPRFARDLWSLFARRRDMSAAAAALERAVDLSAAERTARRAEAYRATGDEAREVAALKEHAEALGAEGRRQGLGPFATRSDLVERYLTLLARRGDRAELRRLASTPASLNGQVADFLLAHGDRELALVALATVGAAEPPVWLEVKRALALAELGDAGPTVLGPLARVLRLGPIAGVRARRTDLKREVVGARAFALTRRYGEILARSSPPAAAARYLGAAVEERPRDPAAYVDLGDRLLRLGAPALAEDAYARAQTLKGHDLEVRDRRAGAALKQGDRPRALRLWGEIIARPGAPLADHLFHARALARAGLGAEARAALAPYLERQASRLDAAALTDALRELRELYPSRAAASEWDRTLGRLLLPTERLAVLAAAVGLAPRGGEPLVDPPARGPYLERGLALLAASTDAAQRWQWRLAHLAWLLETKRLREAEARAVALLSEAGPAAPAVRVALEVARARALVRRGEVDRAVRDLVARGRAGEGAALFEAGIAMLREEQLEPRAALVTAAMYRDLVARGREDRGTLLGLSDALIKLGRREEAVVVLGRLVVREPDDNESQRLAAELLENHRMFADARGPRLTLASLRADDADNRVKLARDEIAMGLRDLGVDRALSLVAERGAPRPARLAAAVVLAEAAGADRRAAAHLADRALALDPAPPEPAAVAVALLRRLAQDPGAARAVLEAVVARAPAPARALALLGDDDLGRGRPQEAARAYERAVYYDGLTPALRRSLFGARRAAGQHDAALLALADDEVPGFLAGLPAHLGADAWLRERGARAAAALAQDGGDAVALAAAARDSARRAGERGRELYYALATTAATRGPAAAGLARDVEAMRAALRIEEDRAGRRRVSRSLDEVGLEPTPAFGAAARAPRGRR